MNYRLLAVAEAELAEAAAWYEERASGLGQEFFDEILGTRGNEQKKHDSKQTNKRIHRTPFRPAFRLLTHLEPPDSRGR